MKINKKILNLNYIKINKKNLIINCLIVLTLACFMFGNYYLSNKFYGSYDIEGVKDNYILVKNTDKKIPRRVNNLYVNVNNVDTYILDYMWSDLLNSGKFTISISKYYVSFNHFYPTIGFDVKATRTDKTVISTDNFDEYKVNAWEKGLDFGVMSREVKDGNATYKISFDIEKKNPEVKSKFLNIYMESDNAVIKQTEEKDDKALASLDLSVNTGVLEITIKESQDMSKIIQALFNALL